MEQLVECPQKCRQGLSGTRWGMDERVFPPGNRRPALLLSFGRRRE